MIARSREPFEGQSTAEPHPELELARQLVAATLFPSTVEPPPPRVPAWQAWLLVGWMAVVAGCYGCSMAGLL